MWVDIHNCFSPAIRYLTIWLELHMNFNEALKLCAPGATIYSTHTEIHNLAGRALPEKMCLYRHAVIMYKLFNNIICENEFLNLNFQLYDNERGRNLVFVRNQRYEAGKNILLNRFAELNNKIDKSWLNLSLETYKIKCKILFLETTIWIINMNSDQCMWSANHNLNVLFLDHNKRL